MKFVAQAKAFSDAMATCSRVVETRNTYPILANVMIAANSDGVTLRTTDLDIEITLPLVAAVSEPGRVTVPARTLASILAKYPKDGEVKIESESADAVKVSSGRSRFSLACISADSFPDLKTGTFQHEISATGKQWAAGFGPVIFAISHEETRYYLNGVYMHAHLDGVMRFVATDGHRMARVERELEGARQEMRGIIVPKKTIRELMSLFAAAGDDPVVLKISDTKICATFGGTVLLSKLIEGTFPDYERVTPKNGNVSAGVDGVALVKSLDRVSTIASEKGGKAVKLIFTDGALTLEVTNPDHGVASDELPASYAGDEKFEIGFNARYIADCVNAMGGRGEINLTMSDAGSPITLAIGSDPGLLYVLMPMRV